MCWCARRGGGAAAGEALGSTEKLLRMCVLQGVCACARVGVRARMAVMQGDP